MNWIAGFTIGMFVGMILAYSFIIAYAKHMTKKEKKELIKKQKEKWKK